MTIKSLDAPLTCYKHRKNKYYMRTNMLQYNTETKEIVLTNWTNMMGESCSFSFGKREQWESDVMWIIEKHYNKTGNTNCWRKVRDYLKDTKIKDRFYDWYLCEFGIATVLKEDVMEDFHNWIKSVFNHISEDIKKKEQMGSSENNKELCR